jgi:hypothetical protein
VTKRIGGFIDYGKLMPAKPVVHSAGSESREITEPPVAERIKALSDMGLRPRDIASMLGVHPMIVIRVLTEEVSL